MHIFGEAFSKCPPHFFEQKLLKYMSRFNQNSVPAKENKIVNAAGGEAYAQSPELELVSLLLTSFAKDSTHKTADGDFQRLKELVVRCNKKFVAQAAIYARTEFGMRSITHVVASELARHISGMPWATAFYNAIIYRPDDMMEIMSYHTEKNGKIPNAMKKGFAKAFDKFNAYHLAKYRGEGKGFKLIDVVNLVHPKANEANQEALSQLVAGKLRSFDTWESELSKAGQGSEDEKMDLKKDAWTKLISERKIGYFALLKNLRNILEQAPDALEGALKMLVDPKLIQKSLVLPFRFSTAFEEIRKISDSKNQRAILTALSQAVDISLQNVPKFDGETLVVLDISGSMNGRPSEIGALFSAVLIKANNADFLTFDTSARYRSIDHQKSTLAISQDLRFNGGGTDFKSIFPVLNKKYDRIFILSDMQGWVGYHCPDEVFRTYKAKYNANPFIYSFDLNSHGSMQFPESKVACIAGFSEKVFDFIKSTEQDKNALVNAIKRVEF